MEQEQSQPAFVAPMARIPQVPPREVAGNRRVYIPPPNSQLFPPPSAPQLHYAPISRQYSQRLIYPQARNFADQPEMPPQTPRPQLLASYQSAHKAGTPSAQAGYVTGVPRTPPYRVPGAPTRLSRPIEPGISETLLGCAILLMVGILALAIVYFLLV